MSASLRRDIVFIGGGMAGNVGAIRAAQLGLQTAVVEEDKLGGTCLHRGCIPTKALLQSAFLLDQARSGERLGVNISGLGLDYARAVTNRDRIVDQLHKGVEFLMKKNRIDLLRGHGRIQPGKRVSVCDGASATSSSRHRQWSSPPGRVRSSCPPSMQAVG